MRLEMWNPVPILVTEVSEDIATAIDKKVYSWTNENKNYLVDSEGENLTTSYHSAHNFIDMCGLKELYDSIIECASQYTSSMGLKLPNNFRVDSWINFFIRNQSEHEHTHYGNFLSGCYYVNAPKGSAEFSFPDPVRERQMWRGLFTKYIETKNILNINSSSYVPNRGQLLMFQSWMPHSVLKHNSDEPRISIAFNVNPIYET